MTTDPRKPISEITERIGELPRKQRPKEGRADRKKPPNPFHDMIH